MQLEVTVPEVFEVFKEICVAPEKLFEMMRLDLRELAGEYLSALMEWELTIHLGRHRYERRQGEANHRNGSYPRKFTMKGLGEVRVKVPRDRQGQFQTKVLPRSSRYEEAVAQDVSLMFLAEVSSRSLSMISQRLLGRKLSHTEISNATRDPRLRLLGASGPPGRRRRRPPRISGAPPRANDPGRGPIRP